MKTLSTTILCLLLACSLSAQLPGSISGKVMNPEDRLGLPNATVTVKVQGKLMGTVCDLDGNYTIKPLPSGSYDVEIRYSGYQTRVIAGVNVIADRTTYLKPVYLKQGVVLDSVTVVGYRENIIDKDKPSLTTIPGKVIESLPDNRNLPSALAALSSKFYVSDDSRTISIRGSRDGDAIYIVDGIKIQGGNLSVPGRGVGSMSLYMGGVPAAYGDFTGGVIIIETKSYFDWVVEQRMLEYARSQAAAAQVVEEEGEEDVIE